MDYVYLVLGFFIGLATGLFPGLHPNAVISILAASGINGQEAAAMIVALLPANLIAAFIPAIFFGIPDSRAVAIMLPGHRLVLEGKGVVALKVVLLSSIITIALSTLALPLALLAYPLIYAAIKEWVKWVLLAASAILIVRSRKPHLAVIIFILAGMLGYVTLNSKLADPFLPLFSGMFAVASILTYVSGKVPEQHDTEFAGSDSGIKSLLPYILLGVLLGFVADLLPGISSSAQVATFATAFMRPTTLGYLSLTSAISISQVAFSFATEVALGKARVGSTAWLANFADFKTDLWLITLLFCISMALAAFAIYAIRKRVVALANVDFSSFNLLLGAYLIAICYVIDGPFGLVVLILGSMLGWLTIKLGVERTALMAAVIVPTMMLLFRVFL